MALAALADMREPEPAKADLLLLAHGKSTMLAERKLMEVKYAAFKFVEAATDAFAVGPCECSTGMVQKLTTDLTRLLGLAAGVITALLGRCLPIGEL